ncbi:unnamed protein product [marine sediment metagenome]|uniref:Uncharacterized protein n=1 Tax=marine sediment metagenome TaxID=412755 RepID=X1IXN8_9ZZZZ
MGAASLNYPGPGLLSGQAAESEDYSGGKENETTETVDECQQIFNKLLRFGASLGVREGWKLTLC